jgi:tetratricopeptide (TPR) repeat protein/TolB-like protein
LNRYRVIAVVLVLAGTVAGGLAQNAGPVGLTVVVIPFENRSHAPGLEWISESFPELLEERLASPDLFVLNREDRVRAYDRVGIPADVHPSHATIYRVAEQIDADVIVLGSFTFDGQTFTATAQLLDMRRERLSPEITESGPLVQLIGVETALAWELLHALHPNFPISKQAYTAAAPPIRLDAFENYVRGVTASSPQDQIQRFREAVRLNPNYPEALLQLGKTYYTQRQYDQAVSVLARISPSDPLAREANFYLGLSAYYQGDYQRAETAFAFVAARMPLPEVYNNLGVARARRGSRNAADFFQRASDTDPNDPDYHFNLGLALYRAGDMAGSSRHLRVVLELRPDDVDAKSLLDSINTDATNRIQQRASSSNARTPLERIRTSYGENAFQQLAFKLGAAAEQRLGKTDPKTHAQYHADRGQQFLNQGFVSEAEKEFREATALDPSSAAAHAGSARVLETNNDFTGARAEAEKALGLRQSAEMFLLLARVDLRDNRTDEAAGNVDQALRLDPNNGQALALKRSVAAKLAEKAQPLPHP